MNRKKLCNSDIEAISDYLAECEKDPLLFVLWSFPWGQKGTVLENETGPLAWQVDILKTIRDRLREDATSPIRIAVASGHGIGKSALVAWLVLWGFGTFANARGVVTANTESQLRTKTWAEVGKWFHLWEARHAFDYTDTALMDGEAEHRKNWRVDCVPWSKENPEAFAGLHNYKNRTLILFDEASSIDRVIWDTANGAMFDAGTQRVWCVFGNPTRRDGAFYDCFNRERDLWEVRRIDSRSVGISDKVYINHLLERYGEDSDEFRVRVRGEFPKSNECQFISSDLVEAARKREYKEGQFGFAPKIIGVDPAWNGGDETAIYLRQGLVARCLKVLPRNENDALVAKIVADFEDREKADGVNIDFGYGTGIKSCGDMWGRKWNLVSFAEKSGRMDCVNKRVEMWANMKDWLKRGGSFDPEDRELADDLMAPELVPTDDGKYKLESKEDMKRRGVHSPNRADALALTFANPIVAGRRNDVKVVEPLNMGRREEYDPFRGM